jgi:hypothetical protein
MLTLNIVLACALAAAIVFSLYFAFVNYTAAKLNEELAAELDTVMNEAIQIAKKKISAPKEEPLSLDLNDLYGSYTTDSSRSLNDELADPAVLATILTILVKKFGDTRLGMEDFMISDTEFVSVYVDAKTKDIILSTNQYLADTGPIMGAAFNDSDDTTFH